MTVAAQGNLRLHRVPSPSNLSSACRELLRSSSVLKTKYPEWHAPFTYLPKHVKKNRFNVFRFSTCPMNQKPGSDLVFMSCRFHNSDSCILHVIKYPLRVNSISVVACTLSSHLTILPVSWDTIAVFPGDYPQWYRDTLFAVPNLS